MSSKSFTAISLFVIVIAVLQFVECNAQILSNDAFLKVKKLGPHMMNSTFYLYGPHEQEVTGTAFVLNRIVKIDTISTRTDSSYFKNYNRIIHNYKVEAFRVLITAAHVLKKIEGDFAYLWLRRKSGDYFEGFEYKIQIRENGTPLWIQPANGADVAVMYITIPDQAEITNLSHTLLLLDKALNDISLNAGDDLSCLGYPYNTYSDNAGFPILRSGKYASYRSNTSKSKANFLFDFKIFPGNSGGPVFVDLKSIINDQGEEIIAFSGIVGMVVDSIKSSDKRFVIDVSEVVPSQVIYETIEKLPISVFTSSIGNNK